MPTIVRDATAVSARTFTRDQLRQLAAEAVRAGELPDDPAVAFSSRLPSDTACTLCAEALGDAPAFGLADPERVSVLHTECFSAWIDVVVTPRHTPAA